NHDISLKLLYSIFDKMVVNLVVLSQHPRVLQHRLSLTVGNAMTLNCSLEGSTLPHITWILPSGTPLRSGARFSKFFHRPDGSLIISNPSIAEVGMYRCLGHNSGGLVERTITLSPGRKAEINNIYNSPVSVMNGETLLLHCQASGEPLRLAWTLPSGVVLNRPQRAGRYAILPNGTLAIHQVSVYDRGGYVCRAANEFGSSLLSVSVIVIAYPPRITSGPPSVTYAKRGVAVQLNCVATGIPKVEVAWETPDKARLAVSGQPLLASLRTVQCFKPFGLKILFRNLKVPELKLHYWAIIPIFWQANECSCLNICCCRSKMQSFRVHV
uniref:Ig-like domain-containing protein n=1 Tax=Amphiprion ocellaris TaxID=80972 RepID=A0A3Q1C0K3_AMPOC